MQHAALAALATLAVLLATPADLRADVTPYCAATPNSVGPGADLSWRGPPTPAKGQLVVHGLPANARLIYVYGQARQHKPFGDGRLCVGPSAFVLARGVADAAGSSTLTIVEQGEREDVRWLLSGLLTSASFQVLYRDAGGAGATSNTSNALAVIFE